MTRTPKTALRVVQVLEGTIRAKGPVTPSYVQRMLLENNVTLSRAQVVDALNVLEKAGFVTKVDMGIPGMTYVLEGPSVRQLIRAWVDRVLAESRVRF